MDSYFTFIAFECDGDLQEFFSRFSKDLYQYTHLNWGTFLMLQNQLSMYLLGFYLIEQQNVVHFCKRDRDKKKYK